MKIQFLLPTLLIPLLLSAQDDDYCSCMETDNSYEELFTSLTQYKEELTLWQRQTIIIIKTKTVIPPKQNVTQVLVEEAYLEEQKKELETLEEKETEFENQVDEEPIESIKEESEKVSNSNKVKGKTKGAKTRIKAKRKRLKGKVKRRKKMRKYRGGCPNF